MRLRVDRSRLLLASVVLALFAWTGCASMKRARAKKNFIHDQTTRYVYDEPIDEVWPQARQLLFEYGYQVRDSSDRVMETEYAADSSGKEVRYLVTAIKKRDGWQVQFMRDRVSSSGSASSARDLDMEWALIRKVDPKSARFIESRANKHVAKYY